MGQKVNPHGFRLGVSKKQNANWYAKGKDFSNNLICLLYTSPSPRDSV